jgi:hypothetical protein
MNQNIGMFLTMAPSQKPAFDHEENVASSAVFVLSGRHQHHPILPQFLG